MEKAGRVPKEKIKVYRKRIAELARKGEVEHRIVPEASSYEFGRARVTVKSRALAKVFDLRKDRFTADFVRRGSGWEFMGIRPHAR